MAYSIYLATRCQTKQLFSPAMDALIAGHLAAVIHQNASSAMLPDSSIQFEVHNHTTGAAHRAPSCGSNPHAL